MANGEIRKQLFERTCQLSVISASPVFIFRDLINWTKQKRIVLPGSSTMEQRIIGKALTLERKRLEKILIIHDGIVTRGFNKLQWKRPPGDPKKWRYDGTEKFDLPSVGHRVSGWTWQNGRAYSYDLV